MCFWITPPFDKVIGAALQGDYFANVFLTNPVVTLPGSALWLRSERLVRMIGPRELESAGPAVCASECVFVCKISDTNTTHGGRRWVKSVKLLLFFTSWIYKCTRSQIFPLSATESLQIKGSAWIPSHVAETCGFTGKLLQGGAQKVGKCAVFWGRKMEG